MQLSKEVINGKYRIAATSTTFDMNGMTTTTGYVEFTEKDEEKVDELIATCNSRESSIRERNTIYTINFINDCIIKNGWLKEIMNNNVLENEIAIKIMERLKDNIAQKNGTYKKYQLN